MRFIPYVIAWFLVYMAQVLSFVNGPKGTTLVCTLVAGFTFLLIGVWVSPPQAHIRREIGWVFLIASGMTVLVAYTLVAAHTIPELQRRYPNQLDSFSDYTTGFTLLVLTTGVGTWAAFGSRKKAVDAERSNDQDAHA